MNPSGGPDITAVKNLDTRNMWCLATKLVSCLIVKMAESAYVDKFMRVSVMIVYEKQCKQGVVKSQFGVHSAHMAKVTCTWLTIIWTNISTEEFWATHDFICQKNIPGYFYASRDNAAVHTARTVAVFL